MNLLELSDIYEWTGLERLVDETRPDVVVLAGDLVCCGSAKFWGERTQSKRENARLAHVKKFYQFL
jgi:UDP-N-acetylglucosamine 2-epimerase